MKKKFLTAVAFFIATASFAQDNLMDWANESQEKSTVQTPSESFCFTPEVQNGKIVCSGTIPLDGKVAKDIFSSALRWVVETYPASRDVLKKMDAENNRFLMETAIISTKYASTATSYKYMTAFQAKDNELVFQSFNISCSHLGSGLSLSMKTETFEELMPDLKPKKSKAKVYLEEFTKGNNSVLSRLADSIKKSQPVEISHWDAIVGNKVIIGMNRIECLLSWGKPNDINTSKMDSGVHEQWVYKNRQYLYFENGILTSMQDF